MVHEPVPDACVRFRIRGRVQGVGFRWWTVRVADELGVRGWVTNLPDGQVEVVATGQADSIAALEARLAQGPRSAHVEGVEKVLMSHEVIIGNSFTIK